ncbi:hypothetical protein PLICRDRAFT_123353 [Plicaturopsis crispa FD-325 SS-3]|nr:hypothetical protein PLICRDRAFT_123353 [Plicaturopsis crispa FD-325 SS-3]
MSYQVDGNYLANEPTASSSSLPAEEDDPTGQKKKSKRRKVNHACLYCRRSHMTCDDGRPCQRCIKREIGHLCHDEQRPSRSQEKQAAPTTSVDMSRNYSTTHSNAYGTQSATSSAWPMGVPQGAYLYQPETLGNEFSVLTDFLETLDERSFFTPPPSHPQTSLAPSLISAGSFANRRPNPPILMPPSTNANSSVAPETNPPPPPVSATEEAPPVVLQAATKTERFLLTAADQESGSRDERLNRVIRSKYEAGLLKPYNYVKGYARLSRWMDRNVSQESKQQILQPLSVLRPKFRAVAQSLRDIDLVFIEEAFERLLLDYDRVFSAMGVPACLWRRTGEIYKGNREFTELVGVDGFMLRDGRLCIYELMAEESAVNYWDRYGQIAFDSSQKAVLTSCVLRYKPNRNTLSSSTANDTTNGKKHARKDSDADAPPEECFINCCFSFTIRRDKWGIPSMIVGNFIKC